MMINQNFPTTSVHFPSWQLLENDNIRVTDGNKNTFVVPEIARRDVTWATSKFGVDPVCGIMRKNRMIVGEKFQWENKIDVVFSSSSINLEKKPERDPL